MSFYDGADWYSEGLLSYKFLPAYQGDELAESYTSRVETYKERPDYPDKQKWFEDCFIPLLAKIKLLLISWEEIIDSINRHDGKAGEELRRFYDLCLQYNSAKQEEGAS